MRKAKLILLFTFFIIYNSWGQTDELPFETNESSWLENIKIGGYIQTKYTRVLETSTNCNSCDDYWAGEDGISLRSVRVKLSGTLGEHISFSIQPDFASTINGNGQHFGQLKDAYFDISLDKKKSYKIRIGQSKIPYGFTNLQSGRTRLSIDGVDGINGGRDLAFLFFWTPENTQELFKKLKSGGLKGTGDYGLVSFGVYNGQTENALELNNNLHVVGRVTYPIAIGNQTIEAGIQAYTGQYQLAKSRVSPTVITKESLNYLDQRAAATFVLFPQPFGIQAEYNWGTGPKFNKETNTIEQSHLEGGYATLSYKFTQFKQLFYPFARFQYYEGGKKAALDARSDRVNGLDFGLEWRPLKAFELVAQYTLSSRRHEDYSNQENLQTGNIFKMQAQVKF